MSIPTSLRMEFVTPDRAIVHEDVDEVQLPGEEGYFGVLPGHAPLLAALRTGEMWYRKGAEKRYAFIAGGFAEVLPDRVSILAEIAERAEDIDLQRAESAKRRAEERLAKPTIVDFDYERARIALIRATARLDVARQARHPRA
jgi:F-type H+-transporting ATPase subunit epsilon